jgi:hypothetical protein
MKFILAIGSVVVIRYLQKFFTGTLPTHCLVVVLHIDIDLS